MLYQFLNSNRKEILHRCQTKVSRRFAPTKAPAAMENGVPIFLQQLTDTLQAEAATSIRDTSQSQATPAPTPIGRAAAVHGGEMLRSGFSVDQVVHEYGDVCQAVTDLAFDLKNSITTDEFRTLNRCLDNAIADAVTAFAAGTQTIINDQAQTVHTRLNSFAQEQRRLVAIAQQAYAAIKTGNIGLSGATGGLLIHALEELRALADRILPEMRELTPVAAEAGIGNASILNVPPGEIPLEDSRAMRSAQFPPTPRP
ncbi:MAG: hypothetical protein ABI648_17605 [Betaproteobacteria bacterium]|jgi:hypothetical protein